MVPDSLQSRADVDEAGIAQILCTVPSARLSLRSSPPAKKPRDRPSGDQDGMSFGSLGPGERSCGQRLEGTGPTAWPSRAPFRRLGQARNTIWRPSGDGTGQPKSGECPAVGRVDGEARGRLRSGTSRRWTNAKPGREAGRHEQGRRPTPRARGCGAALRPTADVEVGRGSCGSTAVPACTSCSSSRAAPMSGSRVARVLAQAAREQPPDGRGRRRRQRAEIGLTGDHRRDDVRSPCRR